MEGLYIKSVVGKAEFLSSYVRSFATAEEFIKDQKCMIHLPPDVRKAELKRIYQEATKDQKKKDKPAKNAS